MDPHINVAKRMRIQDGIFIGRQPCEQYFPKKIPKRNVLMIVVPGITLDQWIILLDNCTWIRIQMKQNADVAPDWRHYNVFGSATHNEGQMFSILFAMF